MPRPKSDLAIMSIKLGEADRASLERLAEVLGTSRNEVIRLLIRAEVKRQERRQAK